MNCRIFPLLFAVFITVSGGATKPELREAFYERVDHLALSLDPRDYIVALTNGQSNLYHDADMNMITEMTIFYYAETVADKHVTLSLTCSQQRDYEVKFEIHRNGVFLLELDERGQYNLNTDFNYAWMDGKVMRFYICFFGRMCSKNAVIIKHPLTHFKIESDDKRALMRIFIKGFFFNTNNNIEDTEPDVKFGKEASIIVPNKLLAENVCVIWFLSYKVIKLDMKPYTIPGSKPREDIILKHPHGEVQISILSLRFAILIILHDKQTKERFGYELFIADKLPTVPVILKVNYNLENGDDIYMLKCKDEI
uniref:Galectin n=1 Tax=Panagrellus redivivus TaxID=6233 RepID=A0A7E4VSX3_PANRE